MRNRVVSTTRALENQTPLYRPSGGQYPRKKLIRSRNCRTWVNVEVRNTSATPRTFAIEAESGIATVTVSPTTTPLLAPGELATISVTASLPANGRTRRDTVQVRAIDAASPAEGGDYAWGLIRITR